MKPLVYKTLDLAAHPWQHALVAEWCRPLDLKESVKFLNGGTRIRRCLPFEFMDGVVEDFRLSVLWPDEYVYELLTANGIEYSYAADREDAYQFFEKAFTKETK